MRSMRRTDYLLRSCGVLLLCGCATVSICVAQQPEPEVGPPQAGPAPAATAATAQTGNTACDPHDPTGAWIDRFQSRLFRLTCSSASWFDGLFGNRRYDEDYRKSYGELYAGSAWSQRTEFDKLLRFHARLYLPHMQNRLHAFIGRVDRDEYVTESASELRALPIAFDRNLEESVLLGLGYNEPLKKRGSFDADVGIPVDWPPDPYVKGSYRIARPVGDRDLIRLRETLFWQDSEGLGTTTRVDWDRVITDDYLFRWTASGTLSEVSEGLRWYSVVTLYQVVGARRALAYQLSANGQTDLPVPLTDYGFTTIYRQPFWRSWLWLELRLGMDWPREFLAERRHSNLNATLAFELRYGGQQ